MTKDSQTPRPRPVDPGGVLSPDAGGSLRQFDVILINTSGGKDSQVSLRRVVLRAIAEGVLDRVVVQHNDLGRVEWPGTRELAAAQAARYGLPLVVRTRKGPDLLEDIRTRRTLAGEYRGFPSLNFRYCTSDHKTAVSRSLIVELSRRVRAGDRAPGLRRCTGHRGARGTVRRCTGHVRVLQVYGFRAEESDDRANRAPFGYDVDASNLTNRDVYDWLPIHTMTEAEVWADIHASGDPYHPIYDEGMPRLSCSFCIYGSRRSLGIARRFRGDLFREYVAVEREVGPFQDTRKKVGGRMVTVPRPLADVPAAEGQQFAEYVVAWTACPTCSTPVLTHELDPVRYCPAHTTRGPWDWAGRLPVEPAAGCSQLPLFVSGWAGVAR